MRGFLPNVFDVFLVQTLCLKAGPNLYDISLAHSHGSKLGLALITALFLGPPHCLLWCLFQQVWLGGWKMEWAVIVSRSVALAPIPVLPFPTLMSVRMP